MNNRLLLFCLLGVLIVMSCASPQKSFDKGNYLKAYTSAVKDMKKGKKSRKTASILNQSFNELIKEKTASAENYLSSNDIEDWEEGYEDYVDLLELYDKGHQYIDDDLKTRVNAM